MQMSPRTQNPQKQQKKTKTTPPTPKKKKHHHPQTKGEKKEGVECVKERMTRTKKSGGKKMLSNFRIETRKIT